jgi:hypothetical protein
MRWQSPSAIFTPLLPMIVKEMIGKEANDQDFFRIFPPSLPAAFRAPPRLSRQVNCQREKLRLRKAPPAVADLRNNFGKLLLVGS